MARLLCVRCRKSLINWEDSDIDDLLQVGVLVCADSDCNGRWVGMQAFIDEQFEKSSIELGPIIKREHYMLVQLLQAAARCVDATFAAAHGDVLLDAAGDVEYTERQIGIVCYEACKKLSYYQVENLHTFVGWMREGISRREDKDREGN